MDKQLTKEEKIAKMTPEELKGYRFAIAKMNHDRCGCGGN